MILEWREIAKFHKQPVRVFPSKIGRDCKLFEAESVYSVYAFELRLPQVTRTPFDSPKNKKATIFRVFTDNQEEHEKIREAMLLIGDLISRNNFTVKGE